MRDKSKSKTGASPVSLLAALPGLVEVADQHGYALAVLGSLRRDYDLIAVAWAHDAQPVDTLVDAIVAYVGGRMYDDPNCDPYDFTQQRCEPKYHGRLSYGIYLTPDDHKAYIDLSVIPPETDAIAKHMRRLEDNVQVRLAAQAQLKPAAA
jgi:hypothetical protein